MVCDTHTDIYKLMTNNRGFIKIKNCSLSAARASDSFHRTFTVGIKVKNLSDILYLSLNFESLTFRRCVDIFLKILAFCDI